MSSPAALIISNTPTTVANKYHLPNKGKTLEKDDVFIGRKYSTDHHYGNPFSHLELSLASARVETREDAIKAFREWLLGSNFLNVEQKRRKWILANLAQLRGKRLVCSCKPKSCHGDVLAELADSVEVAL